jgi:hypothetical protein
MEPVLVIGRMRYAPTEGLDFVQGYTIGRGKSLLTFCGNPAIYVVQPVGAYRIRPNDGTRVVIGRMRYAPTRGWISFRVTQSGWRLFNAQCIMYNRAGAIGGIP